SHPTAEESSHQFANCVHSSVSLIDKRGQRPRLSRPTCKTSDINERFLVKIMTSIIKPVKTVGGALKTGTAGLLPSLPLRAEQLQPFSLHALIEIVEFITQSKPRTYACAPYIQCRLPGVTFMHRVGGG